MAEDKRLFLIDGHALVFKMYYALLHHPMINSKQQDTSILFGFTKYILELIEKEKPSHFAVAFDPPGKTFRHEIYPEYKGTRAATPQLVIDALKPLCEICRTMCIPVLMKKGFEADDVIGSMAKRAEKEGFKVVMVTPDKDYGQLISENIIQCKPGKAGGENELVGVKEICEKYGIVQPEQVIDMLAICGDSADNIPGVNGVGEVGAGKLIAKYGSMENIYAHIGQLTDKMREKFEAARDHMELSHYLVTIKTDIDLSEYHTEDMVLSDVWDKKAAELFDWYEFPSLKKYLRLDEDTISSAQSSRKELEYSSVQPAEAIRTIKDMCSVWMNGNRFVVGANGVFAAGDADDFKSVFEDENIRKTGYSLKEIWKTLSNKGIDFKGELFDLELMHYLINPERSHKIEILSRTYLDVELEKNQENNVQASLFDFSDDISDSDDGMKEAAACFMLFEPVREELEKMDALKLYTELEGPLVRVLGRMELAGIKMDIHSLNEYARNLRDEVMQHQRFIQEIAADPSFNPASPKQVGVLLYEKLTLDPKQKKSASGSYPTDEETLNSLKNRNPVVGEILEFRAAKKLLSTYIEPFPGYISEKDGRIHTTFNQALTATGRLSSSKPNLQNIPIRTERGKEIRKAFVPGSSDGVIVSADYSQIELRIMAHLSCDSHLINAFKEGEDVHSATAAKIFGIDISEVSAEQRRIAKTANFGIMYGISAFGLSQRLGCSRNEAKKIIDDYFLSFPAISAFIEDTLASARERGYVETLFGRRRYVPDINAKNVTVRQIAERNAVNAPIQGTSADIIKLAMINVDKRLIEEGLESRMVLQIHDELLFDAKKDELEKLKRIVVEEMENVIELSIPLTVECNDGKNWLEAH